MPTEAQLATAHPGLIIPFPHRVASTTQFVPKLRGLSGLLTDYAWILQKCGFCTSMRVR
jgi:hypothetical protein